MSKTKITALVLLCLIISTVFFSCANNASADVIYIDKSETPISVSAEGDSSLFYSDASAKEMSQIAKSDMTRLYFDKNNFTIAVYDTVSKKLWRSIPESYGGVKTAPISAEILVDGNSYTLNSQSDSVAAGLAQYEVGENFVKVNYAFKKSLDGAETIDLNIPVTYTLEGGTFEAEIDCSNLIGNENSKNVILKSISLLPFFGASDSGKDGDYILIPDGCGAVIDLSKNPDEFDEIDIAVYGADYSKAENINSKAVIGAFGIKSGSAAFAAVVEDGDEIATLKAEKALKKGGLNSVGACFEITPTAETENGRVAVSSESYSDKIKISYRFLSSENASYIGMASAVRELLVRNKSLSMNQQQISEGYPFTVSLIGMGYDKTANKNEVYTSFNQAYDILSALKAKGVGNIRLRYRGIFDGGINQHDITKAKISLGSDKHMSELMDYAENQNIEIYADVNILTASVKESFDSKAVSLLGSFTEREAASFEKHENNFISPLKIGDSSNSMLSMLRNTAFDGISLGDAGKYLYSDFASNKVTLKSETADIIAFQSAAAASNKKLMIDTGNLYSVKYASSIVNLPASAFSNKNELCTQVPFIQAVLHGTTDYSLTPINTAGVSETMFLRYVEYGAVPYFEWYYTDKTDSENTDKYCYSNSISDAQLYYERMSSALSALRDARITAHEKVKKNVYLTEYDNSTKVYVNYNKKAVTVSGVTVEPRSFVRVN